MKKLLITGGSGFLGSRLALYYKDRYELLLPTHDELNVSREEAVMAYMRAHCPDFVVHCAALSNTWYCEQHPEESHRVNVQATVKLAKACKQVGAKFVFMSSDQVYNGVASSLPPVSLSEGEVLQPVSVYGRHKLEAEQRAQRNNPESVGLRLTWMYDLPDSTMRLNTNILVNLRKAAIEGTTVKAPTNEYRGVTNVWAVVKNMVKTFDLPGGVYNYGSGNGPNGCALNSYELQLRTAELMGLSAPSTWIFPDTERFADQPRNLTMDCALIAAHGIHFVDSLEGIAEALIKNS